MKPVKIASLIYIGKQIYRQRKRIKKGGKATIEFADQHCNYFLYTVTKWVLAIMATGFVISTICRMFQ
jgi:cytochrome oxidase assembly protein ShyY1